ncbi:MAG TPA: magnesium chelatase [Ignavibacteria bacterium]|nr:magnesium chelatase [Bacteroidota bacterium]HRE09759.1 magnesium chelatase [Ignavibacteria bacterium]HRF65515.1 magnesium chelatase [Ignavibacteria bacterium]HRJ02990.1 magnesium chelatase [Ignavibacteria bacterium]HRJ84905.1 magnesium chelatase [Ignavibacteria bacterium]
MTKTANLPKTLGELKSSGYEVLAVKDELRKNLVSKLQNKEEIFPGIIGYEKTVLPQVINAILAKHDIIFLGLRGQAKTKMARMLIDLLDEYTPIVKGSEINDNPYFPISKYAVDTVNDKGDETEIEWIHRERRFGEKLATPDVTIADLIGDIDPIKAATQRLHYSHEGAIHFGIVPRTNRGIFAINELPDLQPRIQVGLLNIMQERDIQIRGFNIRFPLDVFIVYTANPEDYTNRGNIITPLKDRIDSQILTHYPKNIEDGIKITESQSWIKRHVDKEVIIPYYMKEIIESAAHEARRSEFVEQKSGVSARMTISAMENLVSNAERRSIVNNETIIFPRITDLASVLPGMTGKIELVFEGEQEGPVKVSKALIGKSVREIFRKYFPDPLQKKRRQGEIKEGQKPGIDPYSEIVKWFESGNYIELNDDMKFDEYFAALKRVEGLESAVKKYIKPIENDYELASLMEFMLDGLHNNSKIAKDELDVGVSYKDMVGAMLYNNAGSKGSRSSYDYENEEWNY